MYVVPVVESPVRLFPLCLLSPSSPSVSMIARLAAARRPPILGGLTAEERMQQAWHDFPRVQGRHTTIKSLLAETP